MTALAMIQGKLCGDPTSRPTKNGGTVTFFKVRIVEGATTAWWSVATFSDTVREEIAGLREGDAVCVVGDLTIEEWEANGKRGFNRKVLADRALALKARPKARSEKALERAAEPRRGGTRPIDCDAVARHLASPRDEGGRRDWDQGGPDDSIPF